MKAKFTFLVVASLMLVGCTTPKGGDTPTPGPGPGPDPEPTTYEITFVNYDNTQLYKTTVEENTVPEYKGATPTKPEDDNFTYSFSGWTPEIVAATDHATYTATYTPNEKPPVVEDLGLKTIKEVKQICKELTELNQSGIAVDMTRKVTIRGLAIERVSLVKSTKKFGLDVSSPYKVFIGDDTDMIACASPFSNDGTTLWGKVGNHAGKETSKYEVTGYISMYLNQPELYVCDRTYTWDEKNTMGITYDISAYSKETIDLDGFYDKAVASYYNCAGHGYGEVYTVNSLYCYDKRDNTYMMTDGKSVMKVFSSNKLTVGYSYNLTGYVSLTNYVPGLAVLSAETIAKGELSIQNSAIVDTTIDNFKKNKCPKDDTSNRQDNYIRSFKNIYKSRVYFSAYTENGNWYITMGDRFDTHKEYSVNHLVNHISYGEVAISNENYWNIDMDSNGNFPFCPVDPYVSMEVQVDVYYSQFLQEFGSYGGKNDQPIWKVFMINEMISVVE